MDEAKFKFSEYRSGELVNGIDRAAHRALLYCTGLDTDDLHRPLVGVVNSFTEMVPGHIGLRELADYVKQGVWQAGASSAPLLCATASVRGTAACAIRCPAAKISPMPLK